MLKQLGFTLAVSVALTGCGGSSNKSKTSSSSSVATSSAVATSSSVATTSSAVTTSSSVATTSSAIATSSSVATTSAVASTSSAMATSSAVATTSSAVATSSSAPMSSSSSTPSSVAATSSSVASSAANVIIVNMTTGWRQNGTGAAIAMVTGGVNLAPTADGNGAVFDLTAPINLEDAIVEMVINASNELKASGSNVQIFAQIKSGSWPGEWNCWTANADLTPGVDQTISCKIDEPDDAFTQTAADVQVGLQAKGSSFAGTVLIKSAKITLAHVSGTSSSTTSSVASSVASSAATSSTAATSSSAASSAASQLLVNFESDTAGSTKAIAGWSTTDAAATVVTIASITGLPANASSTKVLKVVAANYNAVAVVNVTLPAGKTLANYNLQVDAYFPRDTLGLTGAGGNYYKDFMFLAGTTVSGGAADTNGSYQTKIATIYSDVDAWKTFTFTPDATKAAALSGAIQIGIGISRPAGTDADAYYLDNVQLVPKP